MRVAFAPAALADPNAFRYLTEIAWMFLDGVHHWSVPDLSGVQNSAWLAGEGAVLASDLRSLAKQAARRPSRAQIVVRAEGGAVWGDGAWSVGPEIAASYLRRPVRALVENARVDGAFLRVVVLRVGERALRQRLGDDGFRRLRARWQTPHGDERLIEVCHGGGDTTADLLELLVEAAGSLPPRLLVLVDSDRRAEADPPHGTATRVLDMAATLPDFGGTWRLVPFVLHKHEVENYLPHEALFAVRRRTSIVDPDYQDLKDLFPSGRTLAREVFRLADAELHERALRDRCGEDGRELDLLLERLIALW